MTRAVVARHRRDRGSVPPLALAPAPLRISAARRLVQLYAGLVGYGISAATVIQAGLGNLPWDVFHQGVARHTGLSIGTVSIAVGALALLLWIPLRQRPGLGTLSNVVLVGASIDVGLHVVPVVSGLPTRIGMLAIGVLANAAASALYIGARLGPGPRDGLMTGLAARGLSVRTARLSIEAVVVSAGFLLGGRLGIGTLVYAAAIGPLVHVMLPRLVWRPTAVPWRADLGRTHVD